MHKKNLDKLFQEKLKDFSELPDDKIWQAIETTLDTKKKKRKVIPIWWQLGGAAAALILGLFLYNSYYNTDIDSTLPTSTVNQSKPNNKEENNIVTDPKNTYKTAQEENNGLVLDEKGAKATNPTSSENKKTGFETAEGERSALVLEENDSNTTDPSYAKKKKTTYLNQNDDISKAAVASNGAKTPRTANQSKVGEIVADDNTTSNKELTELAINKTSNSIIDANEAGKEENGNFNTVDPSLVESLAENKEDTSETPEEQAKKSIYDVIAEKEAEEEMVADNMGNRWSAGPSVAPVYYDAMGEGSPVHSIFVPNSKSGDVNLSYGLSVAYEVSKKLSIRSGIHKVDYGYNTNDIEFSSSLDPTAGAQIGNIDFALTASNLVVSSTTNNMIQALNQNPFLNTDEVSATTPARNGTMAQQLGYIEVPVELKYALVDKRIGFNVIGGISSLFLIDNAISLSSGELTTEVGEANNVNTVNFSTNIGFGVNYKFTSAIQLNLEPMFKYQLNTFSDTEGTFQPFSVGVYSGLTFKF